MKTLKGFLRTLRSNPVFLEYFSNEDDVYSNFQADRDPDVRICYAHYGDPYGYSGEAAVIYYRTSTKKYYEAHGSHCSCYGLEGQWSEEELSIEGLEYRLNNGSEYCLEDFKRLYQEYLQS